MLKYSMIGLGGLIGAIGRYAVSGFVQRYFNSSFPAGTLAVNILGCFILGVVMYLIQHHGLFSHHTRMFMTVGVLGAVTTFSTFGHETLTLIDSGKVGFAILSVAGNIILGISAVWLGTTLMRSLGN